MLRNVGGSLFDLRACIGTEMIRLEGDVTLAESAEETETRDELVISYRLLQ